MNDNGSTLLAVLIDADNVPARYAEAIFEEIASFGEASIRRIYGDFSRDNLRSWSKNLAKLAIVPMQSPANTKGKNSSDIALVIDAMDILHTGRFDGFVLVSSDSDFTRLASRIREQGIGVVGMGEQKTPEAFRMACKRFIYLENLDAEGVESESDEPAPKPLQKLQPVDARQLITRAMDSIEQDDEWYSLGQIGQHITAANPDFDPRTYGRKKLSDLIADTKIFQLRRGSGNQFEIRRLD
ncbi:NYN domain-containing protein [Qingshengfaniella alkalisoli]|uniref:NYN domain-containing protein n=1 Tax=Qingshengfaniella alkalisoli TaxID=2599296 RepID=A0A5B8I9Q9_9RHOB|nr:NYN domain-containing protein [Qingshengfaniella alkalisoli]QDY69776.1 NYN domain-containing protein [Qingshengfaniella alkalisoli]